MADWSDPYWEDWRLGYDVVERDGIAVAVPRERGACPRCDGAGRVEHKSPTGEFRVGRCRCQKLIDACALWTAAGVPARHAKCTLDSFRADSPGAGPGHTLALRWLKEYHPQKEVKGLVLEGEPGRGKTHLLCGILREIVFRHLVPARFVEFTHLLAAIRESFDTKGAGTVRLTQLTRIPVLAIDELGKGRKTEWELTIIDEIVSRSYNQRNILLGTTNFPSRPSRPATQSLAQPGLESLEDRLGERVFSRLREMVNFAPVKGDDFRGGRR